MIASIPSATLPGVRSRPVLLEVHVPNGLLASRWLACATVASPFSSARWRAFKRGAHDASPALVGMRWMITTTSTRFG
jgi:hypothetical protein